MIVRTGAGGVRRLVPHLQCPRVAGGENRELHWRPGQECTISIQGSGPTMHGQRTAGLGSELDTGVARPTTSYGRAFLPAALGANGEGKRAHFAAPTSSTCPAAEYARMARTAVMSGPARGDRSAGSEWNSQGSRSSRPQSRLEAGRLAFPPLARDAGALVRRGVRRDGRDGGPRPSPRWRSGTREPFPDQINTWVSNMHSMSCR